MLQGTLFPISSHSCITRNMLSLSWTHIFCIHLDSVFITFPFLLVLLCSLTRIFQLLIIMLYPCACVCLFSPVPTTSIHPPCPPLPVCPSFLSLSYSHMSFLSLPFMFDTIPKSIPLTLPLSQHIATPKLPPPLLSYYFRLFLRR